MIYKNWMSYIKDDVKLCDVVMPGSHNTGSYGMAWTGCCQDGDIYDQFCYGVRHYCMRLDTKNGVIVQCHGVTKASRSHIPSGSSGGLSKKTIPNFF